MSDIKVTRKDGAILVDSGYWTVRHDLRRGGCWDSVTFRHGSGRKLIEAPAGVWLRLAAAPVFVAWKVGVYLRMAFARKKTPAEWVRTGRHEMK